jgi:hypothetical protein
MANEKTPLLGNSKSDTVVVTINPEKLKDLEFDVNR